MAQDERLFFAPSPKLFILSRRAWAASRRTHGALSPCVHVLLHVQDGSAHLTEIYKDDGSPIEIEPERATFRFYPAFPPGWIED